MNKRQIVNKLNVDLRNAQELLRVMEGDPICERIQAQIGYIENMIEWINQEGRV